MDPFHKSLRRARVGKKEVCVEDGTTAAELISVLGEDTTTKSLVQIAPNGSSQILRSDDRINFRDDHTFEVMLNGEAG